MEDIKDYERRSHTEVKHRILTYHDRYTRGLYFLRDKEYWGNVGPQIIPNALSGPQVAYTYPQVQKELNLIQHDIQGLKRSFKTHTHSKERTKYNTYKL